MWLSEKLTALLDLNVEETRRLREDLAAVRAERDSLKTQVATNTVMNDWLRIRVNSLEFEKSALMQKAFNVRMPAPEIVRTERDIAQPGALLQDLFSGPPLSAYDEVDEIA
jgi:hypothetical protein